MRTPIPAFDEAPSTSEERSSGGGGASPSAAKPPAGEPSVNELVDSLFRREFGALTASLVRRLGPRHVALAEDSVQQAMLQALRTWPFAGVPRQPTAWLRQVARNRALDYLRRRGVWAQKEEVLQRQLRRVEVPEGEQRVLESEGESLQDDELRLLFLCCHPALSSSSRVALTLKVAAGFSAREISRAYLVAESTVAQRLVRARRTLRRLGDESVWGPGDDGWATAVEERRSTVLEALYSLFNAGYNAHEGDQLIRQDLCREALRLVRCLALHPRFGDPSAHALASLMAFQSSRLPARQRGAQAGEVCWVPLAEQDRGRWDRRLVRRGFEHLAAASAGNELTVYHLEAAIASHHAGATSWEETPWGEILALYDQLLILRPSPVVRLNRVVALAAVEGVELALAELRGAWAEELDSYHWLHATAAHLMAEAGDSPGARERLQRALECEMSEPERRLLSRRLEELS
ncbi:MAG: sigma-70 family RNA polymerase sigma factor [Acidobacteriota bacterium]